MADRVVLGIFNEGDAASRAIRELEKSGFDNQQISIVAADKQQAKDVADSAGANVAKGAATGAGAGAITGGLAGLAIALSAVAAPGVGPLLVGGPIAAALGLTGTAAATATGAVTGAVSGGLLGALVGLGVPREDAQAYESRIREGGILVTVPSKTTMESTAERILRKHGADQVTSVAAQASSKAGEGRRRTAAEEA